MSGFEKSELTALGFFFSFKVLSDPCEQADWEESQLESYEIIHSPAVGRLSITMCEASTDFFRVHNHSPISTQGYCLENLVKFLDKQVNSGGQAAWWAMVEKGHASLPKPQTECLL